MKHLRTFTLLSLAALSAGATGYDLNGDGVVDRADYTLLVTRIADGAVYNSQYDLDGNGQIDILDANLLLENYTGPVTRTYTVNGVTFKMVAVEGGTFTMGATSEQGSDAESDEKPAHQVTLSSYSIGETEVTQALWQAVMGSNPSSSTGNLQLPVERVRWDDCQTFITKLNQLTGETFRLPTEAEWEYAARGGKQSKGYKYAGSNTIGDVAWYDDNNTHPVGTKSPNESGLYDMSGNVYEWCQDWYGSYNSGAQTNPPGSTSGSRRVLRGGSWLDSAGYCRVSRRGIIAGINYDGLRLAL